MSNHATGTVKFFHTAKGWGIITTDQGEDCFVHHRAIELEQDGFKNLHSGQQVEFIRVRSEKGWQAAEVMLSAPI